MLGASFVCAMTVTTAAAAAVIAVDVTDLFASTVGEFAYAAAAVTIMSSFVSP